MLEQMTERVKDLCAFGGELELSGTNVHSRNRISKGGCLPVGFIDSESERDLGHAS